MGQVKSDITVPGTELDTLSQDIESLFAPSRHDPLQENFPDSTKQEIGSGRASRNLESSLNELKDNSSIATDDYESLLRYSSTALQILFRYADERQLEMRLSTELRSSPPLQRMAVITRELHSVLKNLDPETAIHSEQVAGYALKLATRLGLTGDALEELRLGCLLHDIGKLCIDQSILDEPGKLSTNQYEIMKLHAQFGAEILSRFGVFRGTHVIQTVQSHHERLDGSGYPEALKGKEIPVAAQICMLADVWDALTQERSYKEAWPHERAAAFLQTQAPRQFHPVLVELFLQEIKEA